VCPTLGGETVASVPLQNDEPRLVWMLTWVPGTVLARARPRSPELLVDLGRLLGEMDAALADFSHPAAVRELKWDLTRAGWIRGFLQHLTDPSRRRLVERVLDRYEAEVVPALPGLRSSVIHGDANDHNVVVSDPREYPRRVAAVVDFGDMHRGLVVAEPAVAAAYAGLGTVDPLAAAAAVVEGYHRAFPLDEREIALLFPLITARLAVSVTNSAWRATVRPDDPYVTISEAPAWEVLERLAAVHPRLAHFTFRAACDLEPVPQGEEVRRWLESAAELAAPVLGRDLRTTPCLVLDLGVGSRFLGADPRALETQALSRAIFGDMAEAGARGRRRSVRRGARHLPVAPVRGRSPSHRRAADRAPRHRPVRAAGLRDPRSARRSGPPPRQQHRAPGLRPARRPAP